MLLRRYLMGRVVLPLFLVAALGCGGSGEAESPKVENPTAKVKPLHPKSKPGEEGASMRAE